MHATDDKDIITRVLQGESQAYADLVNRYLFFVFTIASRYTNNREDAEEISQDVFVKAYRSLADFRHNSKFSTWLYTITANTCSTFLRKRKLETHTLDDERVFRQADMYGAHDDDATIQRSRAAMLNKAIGLLSTDDATIITLFYKGEQSLEEIAQILGITPNNAKVKLHRARLKLKDKLELYFADEVKEMIY